MSTPSYSFWAACMVRWALKPSLREASCCRVEVVKGGGGRAAGRLLLDRGDREGRGLDGVAGGLGGGLVGEVELGEPLALVLDQAGQ